MKCIKRGGSLPVKNFDSNVSIQKKHGDLLPNNIRALIVGSSNSGKTNAMISLIFDPNGLKFENIYIYSKSLFQPKYEFLKKAVESVKGIGYFEYSNNDDVIAPEEARENSIFIFDDVACEKQNRIRDYFCMGRHKNIDSFYLCQTYTRIPKHLIRDNANFICIFKQDEMNLRHIFNDHVYGDMTFEDFKKICFECWKDKYSFVCIDKDSDYGRYRKGFDHFIII